VGRNERRDEERRGETIGFLCRFGIWMADAMMRVDFDQQRQTSSSVLSPQPPISFPPSACPSICPPITFFAVGFADVIPHCASQFSNCCCPWHQFGDENLAANSSKTIDAAKNALNLTFFTVIQIMGDKPKSQLEQV
jgi:hypothetical protein